MKYKVIKLDHFGEKHPIPEHFRTTKAAWPYDNVSHDVNWKIKRRLLLGLHTSMVRVLLNEIL